MTLRPLLATSLRNLAPVPVPVFRTGSSRALELRNAAGQWGPEFPAYYLNSLSFALAWDKMYFISMMMMVKITLMRGSTA